jgi:hypothetical protein
MTKTITVKVPSTGAAIVLPPLGMLGLELQLKRTYPKPQPPVQVVDVMGQKREEKNTLDPSYIEEVKEWDAMIKNKTFEMMVKNIARFQILSDDDKAAVADYRSMFEDEMELHHDDRYVWLINIAWPSSEEEMGKLIQSATNGKNVFLADTHSEMLNGYEPSEEAVEEFVNFSA